MSEAELRQMFDAFQTDGKLGGAQLRLCLELCGFAGAEEPPQALNQKQFTELVGQLRKTPPASRLAERAAWREALGQLADEKGELDAAAAFTLLRQVAPECADEELDDLLRQAGARGGRVGAEALTAVLAQ